MLAGIREGSVRLVSRNGHSFTNLFGPVSDALRGFPISILLDGEVIAINDKGQPDFEALQVRLRPRNGKLPGHLCYMVFDCLYVNGHSLLKLRGACGDGPIRTGVCVAAVTRRQPVRRHLCACGRHGPEQGQCDYRAQNQISDHGCAPLDLSF